MALDYATCIGPLSAAERAIAKLDATLALTGNMAPYLAISRLHEAVRSAHLDGLADVDVEKLLTVLHDPFETYQPADVRASFAIHQALAKLHRIEHDGLAFPDADLTAVLRYATQDEMASDAPPLDLRADPLPAITLWIEGCRDLWPYPPLVQAAFAFARFYAVKPFGDLSGRAARIAAPLLFEAVGLTSYPCLFLSAGLRRRSLAPLTAPLRDEAEWAATFCTAAAAAADLARKRALHLQGLQKRYMERFAGRRSSSRLPEVLALLFEMPLQDLRSLKDHLGLSPRGASLLAAQLVEAGVLHELTNRERFRLYLAWDIARV